MSVVALRTVGGVGLRDPDVRDLVVATAHAIAERVGVTVRRVDADEEGVEVELDCDRLASLGFAAELRRTTERWYRAKHGISLWGEVDA